MTGKHLTEAELATLRAFHGHLGPYALAGVRLGRYAVEKLQAERHFGIEADVYCPDPPPPSCFMDGIQWSTGCTLGKRNIRHHVADVVEARFVNKRTGESVRLRLKAEAINRAVEVMKQHGDEAGAAALDALSDAELLEEITDS
jgi:formylmethanofuran dehydrogenase subunit E